jgi:ring-1,2-phenylacetyl-CoA epoxidase subunit PaaE
MAEQQFHELTISAVRPQTATPRQSASSCPTRSPTFAFKPGQYLTLRTKLGGEDMRRSYSICCAPERGSGDRRQARREAARSRFAQGLKPGDRIEVAPPHGRFTAEPGTTGTS